MKNLILSIFLWGGLGSCVFSQGVTVFPGAYVTVKNSGYVMITGTGNLNLKSTADGTASLLDESGGVSLTGSGAIHAERYIVKNSWHIVSPPVTGVTARDFYWYDNPKCWLSSHSETTNTYTSNTNLNTSMPVGQGWMIWLDNAYSGTGATATMTGSLRSSNLTQNVTRNGTGFNLAGNPYPVAIDWQSGTWTRTNLEGTVWVWNNSTNNYLNRTTAGGGSMGNGIIPQGQGFFVHASAASPALTIPADARVHSSQSFYKSGDEESSYDNYLILNAVQGQQSDQVWISFGENGSDDFDNGWDASKLFGGETAPQLYLDEAGRQQSIDHLNNHIETEKIVKLQYKVGTTGNQTLTADLSHFTGLIPFLDDLQTGQRQNLLENHNYQFTGNKEDNPDRFRLVFKNVLGTGDLSNTGQNIFISGGNGLIYIFCNGNTEHETGKLQLFDFMGRLLMETTLGKSAVVTVPTTLKGIVIARVVKESEQVRNKIFIK